MIQKFNKIRLELFAVKSSVNKIESEFDNVISIGQTVLKNKEDIDVLKNENKRLNIITNRLEVISRQNNIIITGIPERTNENLMDLITSCFS